jgi:hypothetical protein
MMAALLYGAGGLALASTCARVLMRQPAESEARRYGALTILRAVSARALF